MLHYTALFSTLYVIPYSDVAKVHLIGQSRPGSHSGRSFGYIPSPGFLCSISAFCRPTDVGQLLVCEISIAVTDNWEPVNPGSHRDHIAKCN